MVVTLTDNRGVELIGQVRLGGQDDLQTPGQPWRLALHGSAAAVGVEVQGLVERGLRHGVHGASHI